MRQGRKLSRIGQCAKPYMNTQKFLAQTQVCRSNLVFFLFVLVLFYNQIKLISVAIQPVAIELATYSWLF